MKTTSIMVGGETWEVPQGFGREYQRVAKLEASGRAGDLNGLLGLVGYHAVAVHTWPLRARVEASVYAANVHLRASDNPIRKHPKPAWFPDAWGGPPEGEGIFAGPGPTPVELPTGSET